LLHHSNTRFLLQPVSLLLMCACDSVPSMTTTNPFPGMNPFFEQQWQDAHTMLIAYLRDALQERLPADLTARAEEEAASIGAGERATTYRPDVQVREPWALKEPAIAEVTPPLPAAPATEPIRVFLDDEAVERWLEIRDTTGRLITVLELLSPSNKLESDDRERYGRKRRALASGGVNVVEIDLVRQGASVFPQAVRNVLGQKSACYGVCVFRAAAPVARELYPIGLRERLPAMLRRSGEADLAARIEKDGWNSAILVEVEQAARDADRETEDEMDRAREGIEWMLKWKDIHPEFNTVDY